jgi:hypothetical protein
MMISECNRSSLKLKNSEIVIRDYLFAEYLDDDQKMRMIGLDNFRFEPEAPENYINGAPQGRVDLKVYSSDKFRARKQYFIIECKRIDGNPTLNRKYVTEGIMRFVGSSPQYTSYFKSNCMLGFLVRAVDTGKNVDRINQLLLSVSDDNNIPVREYLRLDPGSGIYVSIHGDDTPTQITLVHAFADCSDLVE